MADFANADIDKIVDALTTDEAILLTAGVGFWRSSAVSRLRVPVVKVSDGPNGLRGEHFFMSTPANVIPSATALGATFDTELVYRVAHGILATESRLRGANVILAPTCNIQRNPRGGRSFESFAEDPVLSGHLSAAYVNGLQSSGISATIKHFVCNDQENDRTGADSVVSERALREIYLMPFMLAQKLAQPWSYMTAYNLVNGTHASENSKLIHKVLREEWKFEGMVMSDWFGTYSVDRAINAGLDLEMPGLNKLRTLDATNRLIRARRITTRTVKERARHVLEFIKQCAKGAPDIIGGDKPEISKVSEEMNTLMTSAATQSIVLLKNQDSILPLDTAKIKNLAIVGSNAKDKVLSGGGSAAVKPTFFISPYDGLVQALPGDVQVTFAEGIRTWRTTPTLEDELTIPNGQEKRGWKATWYPHESDDSMIPLPDPLFAQYIDETRVFISVDGTPPGITKRYTLVLEGNVKSRPVDTSFEFGLSSAGRAKLYVNDELAVDNWTRQRRGKSFFGNGSLEDTGVVTLKKDYENAIRVVYCNVRAPADGDENEAVMDWGAGVRLGGAPIVNPDTALNDAVQIASKADVVIAVIGLNGDWETEGEDRENLDLPGRTNELIERVAAVNPNAIVVNQSGSAVLMPWAKQVPAIVQAWYLGNTTGWAIASVLLGQVNPSGKLPLTFPKRLEDVPSEGHFHSEGGEVRYAEDLFVGYKNYVFRNIRPQWAFGHGLSYTTFHISQLSIFQPKLGNGDVKLHFTVLVKNTGSVAGAEVVQAYITMPTASTFTHPPIRLVAFKKVTLTPNAEIVVGLQLDKYAVSRWDVRLGRWVVEKGIYGIKIGNASDRLHLEGKFELEHGFEWNGL